MTAKIIAFARCRTPPSKPKQRAEALDTLTSKSPEIAPLFKSAHKDFKALEEFV